MVQCANVPVLKKGEQFDLIHYKLFNLLSILSKQSKIYLRCRLIASNDSKF